MSDYISRQAAIGMIEGEDNLNRVERIPAADVVEVVRCKDCLHNHITTWNHGERDKPQCHFTDWVRSNEFYCGFGERAEQ